MKKTLLIFTIFNVLLYSCGSDKNVVIDNSTGTEIDDTVTIQEVIEQDSQIIDQEDEGCLPPFNDTCVSSFARIAQVKINDTIETIVSGKDWNPEYCSCTYTWGELINNEIPNDSSFKSHRIYLVDLDSIESTIDKEYLDSDEFKNYTIAKYYKKEGEEYKKSYFDPYKIGKYPKPSRWVE